MKRKSECSINMHFRICRSKLNVISLWKLRLDSSAIVRLCKYKWKIHSVTTAMVSALLNIFQYHFLLPIRGRYVPRSLSTRSTPPIASLYIFIRFGLEILILFLGSRYFDGKNLWKITIGDKVTISGNVSHTLSTLLVFYVFVEIYIISTTKFNVSFIWPEFSFQIWPSLWGYNFFGIKPSFMRYFILIHMCSNLDFTTNIW